MIAGSDLEMGRRHSKYIIITALMLAILIPFYFLLDSTTTDVVRLSSVGTKSQKYEEERLDLQSHRTNRPKEITKKRYDDAPIVAKPKFLPYPTKAKPGAPWLDFPTKVPKNKTRDANNSAIGDSEVVIQTVNKTLLHTISPAPSQGTGDLEKTKNDKNTASSTGEGEKTAVHVAEDIISHDQVNRLAYNSKKQDKHKLLIGGMVLDNVDPSEAILVTTKYSLDKREGNKDETSHGVSIVEPKTTLPAKSRIIQDALRPNNHSDPSLKVEPHGDSDVGFVPSHREAEDWRKLLDQKSEDKNNHLPVQSHNARASDPTKIDRSINKTQLPDNWRNFFDNPVEVLDNNKHVNVSLDIDLPGKRYIYPTKPKPEAPVGVDFYRRRGDNSKPEHFINGAEPEKIQVSGKSTVNPYDVFDKEVTIKPLEAWARRNYEKLEGENIVSMTLYGSDPRYTMGAIRNAELVKENFRGWKLRVYTETPSENPRYGSVPNTVLTSLRNLGAEIYFMQPGEDYIPPMMWRFLVADDLWVSRFIVRDSDSRLTERDAAAVYAWVKSNKPFNCIRDHPSHASYAISGGMWGGKPSEIRNILRRSWRDLMRGVRSDYLQDMNFLNYVVWPKMQNQAYCSDSVSCDQWPGAHPFPVPRYGYEHVGQVVNEHDLGRPIDIQLLRKAGENSHCSPKDTVLNKT